MEILNKDLVIIGAGPGGYELASNASKAGLNVALIEKEDLGGTCLNHGCIPTKTYFHYAKLVDATKKAFNQDLKIDFNHLFNHKNEVIKTLNDGVKASLKQVLVLNGEGKLVKENGEVLVKVNDTLIKAKSIVIATGSIEAKLDIKGSEYLIDARTLLDMDHLPSSISIIGGGVIGMEMASILNALGVNVNVIEYAPSILPRMDNDITRRLHNLFKQKGINIFTKSLLKEIKKDSGGLTCLFEKDGESFNINSEVVLCSIGRIPNVYNLGLEEVGIEYNKKGIITNEFLQTNISNIYAIGDVRGGIMLAHKASYDAKVVLGHILGTAEKVNYDLIPSCCFTIPEVSTIGLSEEEATKLENYRIIKELYRANGKAQAIGEVDGLVKIIISDDYIVGATIIGEEANLMIHEIAILMNAKIKVSEAKNYIHAHPTLSEIIQKCLNGQNL